MPALLAYFFFNENALMGMLWFGTVVPCALIHILFGLPVKQANMPVRCPLFLTSPPEHWSNERFLKRRSWDQAGPEGLRAWGPKSPQLAAFETPFYLWLRCGQPWGLYRFFHCCGWEASATPLCLCLCLLCGFSSLPADSHRDLCPWPV